MMKAVVVVLVMAVALVAARQDALEAASNEGSRWQQAGAKCKKPSDCGGGLRCNPKTAKCERVCAKAGDACKTGADCCSATCRDGVCLCYDKGATCTWGDECCDGSCSSTKGCCRKSGTSCEAHNQCCSGICQAPVAAAPALIESDATPAAPATAAPAAAGAAAAPAAAGAAAPAKKDAPAPAAAKKADAKAEKKTPAKKMQPVGKQCCSDFGQKCSDSEPCCPPNICSDLLGMCTLAVKID